MKRAVLIIALAAACMLPAGAPAIAAQFHPAITKSALDGYHLTSQKTAFLTQKALTERRLRTVNRTMTVRNTLRIK